MLPCKDCAYRQEIPGNNHIRCAFEWKGNLDALVSIFPGRGVPIGYFQFPFQFDPVWGANECPMRADVADPAKTHKFTPMEEMLSLM